MRTLLRRPRVGTVVFAILLAALGSPARAADETARARAEALRPLEPFMTTGVLYDRVLPLAHLERLDGSTAAPAIDRATWRQAYSELWRASAPAPAGLAPAALDADARASLRAGVVPLALFDRAYERIRPEALEDGSLIARDGRLEPGPGAALLRGRAVAAAVLAPSTFRGGELSFALDAARCLTDDANPPRELAIDFDDGLGFRPVAVGERVSVRYATTGSRTLTFRLARADGSTAETRAAFEVAALATPVPDETLHVTATVPYQGRYGTGDAYVYRAPGHAAIVNPVVAIEGFDLDNSMGWDELYALLNGENLLEDLRADGFDAIVLDFTDATAAVEENGLVVARLVEQVQEQVAPQTTLALVGASMGGLCSRYALAYLESRGLPHRVRTWISFDGPQAGADIPLGLQYWIDFFSGQSADAAAFLATLQRPAAREMLLHHFTSPPGTTGQADPLRDSLLVHLAALGGYPQQPRRVAIANGSGTGLDQGFAPGAQLIRYEYSSLLASLKGNVWAVPDQVSGTIFDGSLRILFSTTTRKVTVSGTQPWDGAPGGWRGSLAQLDSTAAPYGDIVALHPAHCFIPLVSALDLATADPFFAIAGAPDPLALTPFDAIYHPAANQEHVLITPENAVWVRTEIEAGVVAVADPPGARVGLALAAAPNPARGECRLSFALARAGEVDLRLFDVRGREVRVLARGGVPAGAHAASWDGRDAQGTRVAPGVYFVRLAVGSETVSRRIVRLD